MNSNLSNVEYPISITLFSNDLKSKLLEPWNLISILIHAVRKLSKLTYSNLLIRCTAQVTSYKGRGYHLEDTFSVSPKSNAIKSVNPCTTSRLGGIRVKGGVANTVLVHLYIKIRTSDRVQNLYLDLVADDATEADRTDEEIDECGGDTFFGFWIWFLCGNWPLGELLGDVDAKLAVYLGPLTPVLLCAIREASIFRPFWAFLKLPAGLPFLGIYFGDWVFVWLLIAGDCCWYFCWVLSRCLLWNEFLFGFGGFKMGFWSILFCVDYQRLIFKYFNNWF